MNNSELTPTEEDMGLGDKVIQENSTRFINKDGSFNVHRKGVFDRGAFSPYHAVLNASWKKFNLWIFSYYVVANLFFAALYILCGKRAFPDIANLAVGERFRHLFTFSVQVITTLGSSPLHPATALADAVLAVEAMAGMMGFAVAASLLFARFSNPATNIIFSEKGVIAPYGNITGFMFRIVNGRNNELINVNATLTVALKDKNGKRAFHQVKLERDHVLVFPLNWTVVHPINSKSPIYGMSAKELTEAKAEFLVTITATDQDLAKTIHVRTSYLFSEVVMGAKFVNILEHDSSGAVTVDPKRIGEIEKLAEG